MKKVPIKNAPGHYVALVLALFIFGASLPAENTKAPSCGLDKESSGGLHRPDPVQPTKGVGPEINFSEVDASFFTRPENIPNVRGEVDVAGDIEGFANRWKAWMEDGTLRFHPDGRPYLAGRNIVQVGDLWRRGPWGRRSVRWALALAGRNQIDPFQYIGVLGNHDVNTNALVQWHALMKMGKLEPYKQWLKINGRINDLTSEVIISRRLKACRTK